MAKMPIEIVTIGSITLADIEQAISLANSIQGEFFYHLLDPADAQAFRMLAYQKASAEDFLNLIENRRSYVRGFHPFLIAVVDTELEGKYFSNLFGSHRAEKGIAVITTSNVEDVIVPHGRMAAYFLYYFARYTLSFIVPNHRNHEETKDCVFDRKINKHDIKKSMKSRAICDECRNILLTQDNGLTPPQFEALDVIFSMSGETLKGQVIESLPAKSDLPIVAENNLSMTKVLFLAANPIDTDSLRLDAELRAIDQSIQLAEFRNRFNLQQHWAVQVKDVQYCLLRHKPDIVHFSGHGSRTSEIILEDASGNSHPVPTHALGQLFSALKDNIRCVVLNACYSELQAQAIAQSIDCVIGMSKAIGDHAAIGFAAAFYQALGFGRDVRTAFELGRAQIGLEGLNDEDTPKLIANRIDPRTITFVTNKR